MQVCLVLQDRRGDPFLFDSDAGRKRVPDRLSGRVFRVLVGPGTLEGDFSIRDLDRLVSLLIWRCYRLPVCKITSCSFASVMRRSARIASGS